MMRSPLQYHSLKVVLQHMDANNRFRISLHMPSIREVEKKVPLKIDRLVMGEMIIDVDYIEYRLEIIRRYREGRTPEVIKNEERWNDFPMDYDEFGFPVHPGRNVLLPGDIPFHRGDEIEERFDTEEHERRSRADLRVSEKSLERLTELNAIGMTVEDYLQTVVLIPDENDEENRIRQALEHSSEQLPQLIEQYKLQVLPFDCRKNNTKPPFTCYIKMTIWNGQLELTSRNERMMRRERIQIKLFEYTKKLFEASKHMHDVFFGRRTENIQVRNLDLEYILPNYNILRLPPAFRMQTQKATVRSHHVSNENFSLLVENSNSLDILWIDASWEPDNFQSQAVRNAKRLVIADNGLQEVEGMVPAITNLPNLEMTIMPMELWFGPQHYFQIIQAWLARERPVGASCWMMMRDDATAEDVLELVGAAHERTEITQSFVTIYNNGSTKIEIFYEEFIGPRGDYEDDCNWIMKTRVVKV